MPRPGTPIAHPQLNDRVRGVQNAAMPDQCIIRTARVGVIDETTGRYQPTSAPAIYEGPCRFEPVIAGRSGVTAETGDQPVTVGRYVVSIPYDTTAVHRNAVVTITAARDPQGAGRHFVVREVAYDTFQTRRLLNVELRDTQEPIL